MRGFEGFFSPVVPPRPVASTARRPWGEREEKGSREEDPDRRPPSASAAAATAAPAAAPPPSRHVSMHPELGPPSASSFGSIPSPVREVREVKERRADFLRPATELVLPTLSPRGTKITLCCFAATIVLLLHYFFSDRTTTTRRTTGSSGDASQSGPRQRNLQHRDDHRSKDVPGVTVTSAGDAGREGCDCGESASCKWFENRFFVRRLNYPLLAQMVCFCLRFAPPASTGTDTRADGACPDAHRAATLIVRYTCS